MFDLTAAVAVAVGMWKPVSLAGFQAPRASRTVSADLPSSPLGASFPQRGPQFIGHSGENVSFGRPASGNKCLSETRVECTFVQILAQSPFLIVGRGLSMAVSGILHIPEHVDIDSGAM